jgi:hypothetical protein
LLDARKVAEVRAIYERFRPLIDRYRGGFPAGLAAAVIQHESGGNMNAPGDVSLGEVGLFQVTREFPTLVGVDPEVRKTVEGNIFLGLLEYQLRAVEMKLFAPSLISLGSMDSWKLARLAFAIGAGGTKQLIAASNPRAGDVFGSIRDFVDRTGGVQVSASQGPAKVLDRVHNIDTQWDIGAVVAPLFYGMPEKIPAPPGVTYKVPAAMSGYLRNPLLGTLLVLGLGAAALYFWTRHRSASTEIAPVIEGSP